MPIKYTHVKGIEAEIIKYKEQGKSSREIGKKFGLSKKQVDNLLYRYRTAEKDIRNGVQVKGLGRPRKKPITQQRELELENKRLRMENELLRDFLKETERR